MIRFKLKEVISETEFQNKRKIKIMEISDKTGVNRMTLSKMLNHYDVSVTTRNLDKLCKFFNCKIEDLLEYIEEPD